MSRAIPTAEAVVQYVAGRHDLVHAAYLYGCRACRRSEFIYLGVGVEGPDRDVGAWIASPFMGPACPKCGSETQHIAWHLDVHFRTPIEPPYGARYFRVPDRGPDPERFNTSFFCGEIRLSEPRAGEAACQ